MILQHGLLDNSATWLLDTDNTCILPFMFADLGYDVWMTNTRGNRESFEHMNPIEFNANDHKSKYWNFSWDEMAMYDLPYHIDHIRAVTKQEKVFYVGHS